MMKNRKETIGEKIRDEKVKGKWREKTGKESIDYGRKRRQQERERLASPIQAERRSETLNRTRAR